MQTNSSEVRRRVVQLNHLRRVTRPPLSRIVCLVRRRRHSRRGAIAPSFPLNPAGPSIFPALFTVSARTWPQPRAVRAGRSASAAEGAAIIYRPLPSPIAFIQRCVRGPPPRLPAWAIVVSGGSFLLCCAVVPLPRSGHRRHGIACGVSRPPGHISRRLTEYMTRCPALSGEMGSVCVERICVSAATRAVSSFSSFSFSGVRAKLRVIA